MTLLGRHLNLGIAYTDQGAAALRLVGNSEAWRVLDPHYVSWRNEGLTDEDEIRQAAQEWMRDIGASAKGEANCLLPQSIVNTVVADFPPVHDKDKLEKMVTYQTQQLAGLSGTTLVNGFQEIVPMPGQSNPMLVAVAPEEELNHWSDFFCNAEVNVGKLVPAGLALYNAFTTLQEVEASGSGLQAILECGPRKSILVIHWQSRIQAIQVLDAPADNPDAFGKNVLGALHAWKNTQIGDARFATPEKIWLSGELATTNGFLEGVKRATDISVQLLGVPNHSCPQGASAGPVKNGVYPAMTLAFGLAAQNLGIVPLNISLLPEKLSWRRERLREFPFLMLAALVLVLFLSWLFFDAVKNLFFQERQYRQQELLLDTCLETAPKLKQTYQQLQNRQLEILPIVEASLRTKRYINAIQSWYDAVPIPKQDAWCIYLADEFSFNEENAPHATNSSPRRDNWLTGTSSTQEFLPTLVGTPPQGNDPGEENTKVVPVMPPATPVYTIPILTRMYAGGVLPATSVKYQAMKDFQGELNRSDLFINVDDYTDFLSKEFHSKNLVPWENFLKTYKNVLKKDYTFFFLQLPFLETPVQLPSAQSPATLRELDIQH